MPTTNKTKEIATAMRRAVFLVTIFAIIMSLRDELIQWEIERKERRWEGVRFELEVMGCASGGLCGAGRDFVGR